MKKWSVTRIVPAQSTFLKAVTVFCALSLVHAFTFLQLIFSCMFYRPANVWAFCSSGSTQFVFLVCTFKHGGRGICTWKVLITCLDCLACANKVNGLLRNEDHGCCLNLIRQLNRKCCHSKMHEYDNFEQCIFTLVSSKKSPKIYSWDTRCLLRLTTFRLYKQTHNTIYQMLQFFICSQWFVCYLYSILPASMPPKVRLSFGGFTLLY